jgi:Tol biopolymer transport system component
MKLLPLLIVLVALAGCRDQYPSQPGSDGRRKIDADFLLTDLSRRAIVQVDAAGESGVIVPASTGELWGDDPLLLAPVENGKMAYVAHAHDPSGAAVWLATATGTGARILSGGRNTGDSLIERSVVLSSDGAWIAWAVASGSDPQDSVTMSIYRTDLTGSGGAFTCAGPGVRLVGSPAFSTDGSWIAWLRVTPGDRIELVRADLDGGNQRVHDIGASSGALAGDEHIEWSPDGACIAFPFAQGPCRIAFEQKDVSSARIRTVSTIDEMHDLTWSPDGATLAFTGRTGTAWNVWTMDTADLKPVNVSAAGPRRAFGPRWSPDGSKLLYLVADAGAGRPTEGTPEILEVATGRRYRYPYRTSAAFWVR